MFLDELSPFVREMTQHPVAFLGGFVSGMFRLNLADDPVKSWLDQQGGASTSSTSSTDAHHNGSSGNNGSSGPKTISID